MKITYMGLLCLLVGCSSAKEAQTQTLEPQDPTRTILYYPGPGIDLDVAQEGAEKLLELGIEALPTQDLPSAQIRIRFILCDSEAHMKTPYMAIMTPGIMFPKLDTVEDFTTNDLHEFDQRLQVGSIDDPACADHWKDPLRRI